MNTTRIEEIVRRLVESVPPGVRAVQQDLESNFRAVLRASLTKLDLVSRDEFDAQDAGFGAHSGAAGGAGAAGGGAGWAGGGRRRCCCGCGGGGGWGGARDALRWWSVALGSARARWPLSPRRVGGSTRDALRRRLRP